MYEENKTIPNKLLVFLTGLIILFVTFLCFIFISVDKVYAQSAKSYNIRFMNTNATELASADKANLTYDGGISYLLSTGYFDNITAGSYIYFNQKHTLAIRFNPNYIKVTGLKVQYYYVTLSGDSVEMTGFCSDSATLTKDLTYDNSWLYQYKINSTCELKNTYSTDRIIVRISPIYSTSNNSYIIRTAYNINSFSVTNDPSEAELIINNQNQNTQDIIDNNNQNTEDIINNQNSNTDKITDSLDKNTESNEQINDSITDSNTDGANDSAGGFFNSFDTDDNGGISGIITAPLVAINQMLSQTCVDLTGSYKGKEFSIPSGCEFWAKIPDVKDFLNVVEGGLLCYLIIRKLFYLVQRLKNPEDDRVEVMSL